MVYLIEQLLHKKPIFFLIVCTKKFILMFPMVCVYGVHHTNKRYCPLNCSTVVSIKHNGTPNGKPLFTKILSPFSLVPYKECTSDVSHVMSV